MRILHFITSIDRASGGTSAYMQLLAKELGRLVELHVATHRGENPLTLENCTVHYINGNALGLGMKEDWLKVLDSVRPDMVHVNCCWMPEIALAQWWAQERGYKVVLTPHGMLEPWIMRRHYWTKKLPALLLFQKKAVKRADMLHATATSEKEHLEALGLNKKITVIANGIDVEAIEMKRSWRRNGNILFLSRIHVKKGINFLIEAVAAMKDVFADYTINIAGEGEEAYINELKQLTRQLGIERQVNFIGGVYGDMKWRLFKEADLFVLPTHSENFGIVVAEALASGTPVITTKGTPWSDLEEYGCGWWTEVGTEPTAKALSSFLSLTEQDIERMGRNGRRLVEEKYSAKNMAEQMVKMYEQLNKEL